MYFDDYSTSFQSLYSPMYNLQTTYSANMNPYGGYGFGAGYCAGMYPGMGMLMNPLAGVGVGQFNGDYLVRNEDQKNNYYARPIATHKKKDELPTILGIIGTTLGTAAVLLALKKGKKIKNPVRPVNSPVVTPSPVRPTTNPITDPSRLISRTATPANPVNPVVNGPTNPVNPIVNPIVNPVVSGPVNPTPAPVKTTNVKGLLPVAQASSQASNVKGLLPAAQASSQAGNVKGLLPAGNTVNPQLKPIEYYYGNNNNIFNLPANQQAVKGLLPAASASTGNVKGLLPAHTPSKMEVARERLETARNLPSSGEVYVLPEKGSYISPVITRKNNRFAEINGQKIQHRLSSIGLEADTKALAKLTQLQRRHLNDVILNGTDAQLKFLTCSPEYENIFRTI